jgi:hypothetical protein
MNKVEFRNIILIFIAWKFLILVLATIGQLFFPLQTNFLGGGLLNYLRHPIFWGFINFDGEHYLSIARDGYLPLTYFYFPLYPLIIKLISGLFGNAFSIYALSGLLLSNIFLIVALTGMVRLGKLITNNYDAKYSVILLLLFPTSFYFGAFYNESLFLMLAIWSLYFALKRKWFLSFFLCGLSTATRLVGIALIPALLYEYYIISKNKIMSIKSIFYLFVSSFGIIIYSIYLRLTTGDFFSFFRNIEIFGSQRSSNIIMLPQVFYRYIFKILPNINYHYIPIVFTTYLEAVSAILFLIAAYYIFIKMRISILIYYALAYLIPTFSGSFSSFPRYSLALFPAFLVFGYLLKYKSKPFVYAVLTLLLLSSFLAVALFIRGYFVS